MHARFLFGCLSFIGLTVAACGDTYTYPQLVNRMTNMRELAKLPPAGEKTSLASSYDRSSQYDPATDQYIKWDANRDGSGVIRMEGDESVLMDVQGPGCIWRTWSATAGNGHVKIYLDGAETPTVDLPLVDYFSDKVEPFNRPHIVYHLAPEIPGFDNYTPIPFQKSCKIVGDKGWGNYYQFTYTQFPAGTVVPTFQMKLAPDDAAALDKADQILANCGQEPSPVDGAKMETAVIQAVPGKDTGVIDLSGAGAITALKVKLDLPADAEAQRVLLRQLTVSITWDDDAAPAVWSPLGDFFAYVGGAKTYQALPMGLMDDGTFYAYWYMPFGKKARITVGNDGPEPVPMTWQIEHAPLTDAIGDLARFHAKWHRDAFLPDRKDRQIDWTLLTTQGRGRYVGTHLHGWNPRGGWWGEGDDKFFVDGEKFPSSFGTGSEDYFGYAWSSQNKFSRPYHNQILNENNEGHLDDNRFHIADSVPFDTSLEADIEKYFQNSRGTLYAAEAYWYLSADGTDPYTPVPVGDRIGYWVTPEVFHEPGVIEGESLTQTAPAKPETSVNNMMGVNDAYSGGHYLEWHPPKEDTDLALALPVDASGRYDVIVRCDQQANNGNPVVQFSINGKPLGPTIDLTGKGRGTLAAPVDLGVVDLLSGTNTLGVQIVSVGDPTKRLLFGLDYVKLVPEK